MSDVDRHLAAVWDRFAVEAALATHDVCLRAGVELPERYKLTAEVVDGRVVFTGVDCP